MSLANQSVIQQQEDEILKKRELFLAYFKSKGFEFDAEISDTMWFFQEINQDQQHILWSVISDSISADGSYRTVEQFIDILLEKAKNIHLKLVDVQMNKDYLTHDKQDYDQFLQIIEKNQNDYQQENAFVISFQEKINQLSDIQKYYQLKYKIGTVNQNYQDLYPENSNRSTCFSIDSALQSVTLVVMGKRLDKGNGVTPADDFKELAQIEIPLKDIYQTIRPRHFALITIPPTYLAIKYTDQCPDAPSNETVSLSLRFDLRMGWMERQLTIKDLKTGRTDQYLKQCDEKIKELVDLMNQLLSPFKSDPKLHYVPARGIGQPKDFPAPAKKPENKDKPRDEVKSRDACCIIQ